MSARKLVMNFLQNKGVDTSALQDEQLLMQYIQSADFMELIITAELELGCELDLESASIEEIGSIGGFIQWLEN